MDVRNRLATLVIISATSLAFGGCRLGNHVEKAPNPDQISGYYATSAQELTFCVTGTATNCAAAPVNQVPAQIAVVMTNPIALILDNIKTGDAYLAASDNSGYAIPIFAEASGAISFVGSTDSQTLWLDPACTSQLFIEEEGTFTRAPGGTSTSGLPLSGTLAVRIQMIRTIDGDCADTMTQLHDCYNTSSQCGGASVAENEGLQRSVQDLFNPYITAGVMAATGIPDVRSLAFETKYQ